MNTTTKSFQETVITTYSAVAAELSVAADAVVNRLLPQAIVCASKTVTLTAQTCAVTLELGNAVIETGINYTKDADQVLALLGLGTKEESETDSQES